MKPTDFRNAAWRDVLTHVQGDMLRVHDAWLRHGPGTTEEVAQKSGISIFTFRPRTTDLTKLGLVALVPDQKVRPGGGVYEFRTPAQAEAAQVWKQRGDFRRSDSDRRRAEANGEGGPARVGFMTVEEAIASMSPAERRALGARLMGESAHGRHRSESSPGAQQLDLLTA
jgi:hypothetical protein